MEGLKGRQVNLAKQLLQDIEKSELVSWDFTTMELIVDGKAIAHSHIKLLVHKLVIASSPILPLGLVTFVDALLRIRAPLTLIRDSDCLNIRDALLKIRGKTSTLAETETPVAETTATESSSTDTGAAESSSGVDTSAAEISTSRKRGREAEEEEEDEEDGNIFSKRIKINEGQSSDPAEQPRRSSRLKKNLSNDWQTFTNL